MPTDASTNRIAGLEALLKSQGGKGPAPVEQWDPPYCGDIGMKIRADGVWIYGGTPIGRMPLVKLFASILRKEDGFRDPEILLNPIDSRERRRFICAHAIGHYSRNVEMRRHGAWEVVDGRDFFATDPDPEEAYASAFAAELLMPWPVLQELDDTTGAASLAALFGVTGDVMCARLDRIGWRR